MMKRSSNRRRWVMGRLQNEGRIERKMRKRVNEE